MRLTTYQSADAFLDAVRPELARREVEHHLLLGVAEAAATGRAPNADLFAAAVHDDTALVLAALMTRERPLLIASDRDDLATGSALVWEALAASALTPVYAIGAVGQIELAIDAWTRRGGPTARVAMRQRVYSLTAIDPVPPVSGALRVATPEDLDLVAAWIADFEAEALAAVAPQSTKASAERRIRAGEVHLWCDPEPRTMAACARPTARAIAVNGVYTPPEWRRRGYATACVAALSDVLLRRGFEFCVLYTDLSNPTSNAIYTRIGYRPVRDFLMYDLSGPPAT
jgi:predicted GNAT family acetyltransferase